MIKSLDLGFDETETTLLAMFSTSHCYLPTHKSPFTVDSKLCIKYYVCVCVCGEVWCGVHVCVCVCWFTTVYADRILCYRNMLIIILNTYTYNYTQTRTETYTYIHTTHTPLSHTCNIHTHAAHTHTHTHTHMH